MKVTTQATGNGYHNVLVNGVTDTRFQVRLCDSSNGNNSRRGKRYAISYNGKLTVPFKNMTPYCRLSDVPARIDAMIKKVGAQ